jgi:hypothetical protein
VGRGEPFSLGTDVRDRLNERFRLARFFLQAVSPQCRALHVALARASRGAGGSAQAVPRRSTAHPNSYSHTPLELTPDMLHWCEAVAAQQPHDPSHDPYELLLKHVYAEELDRAVIGSLSDTSQPLGLHSFAHAGGEAAVPDPYVVTTNGDTAVSHM